MDSGQKGRPGDPLGNAAVMEFMVLGGPLGSAARAMQGQEDWPCDYDPGFVQEANALLERLDRPGLARMIRSGDPDLLGVLTYMGVPRFVLLLRSLADALPESDNPLAEIIQHLRPRTPATVPHYNACVNRLIFLERVEVLKHVYNGARLRELSLLLKEAGQ